MELTNARKLATEYLRLGGHRDSDVTTDHIETLSELDREYGHVAEQAGITYYRRAPALNERTGFMDALADIVHAHLTSGEVHSSQYPLRCAGCVNPQCRKVLHPAAAVPGGR